MIIIIMAIVVLVVVVVVVDRTSVLNVGRGSQAALLPAACKHGWSKHDFSRIPSKHP